MGCGRPEPRWELSVGWSGFDTELRFSDARTGQLREHAVTVSAARLFPAGWAVRVSGGVVLGGEALVEDIGAVVRPGWTVSAQGVRQWNQPEGAVPYLANSLSLSASRVPTRHAWWESAMTATDVRLGLVVGWRIAEVWSPYLAARVFGGPVFWKVEQDALTATDRHHYNAGLGSRVELPGHTALWVDASLLGERSLSAGFAVTIW